MFHEDEFVDCMAQDFPQLKVTKNDLAKPTKQFIMQYFSALLEQITRMGVRSLCTFTEEQHHFLKNYAEGQSLAEHMLAHNLYMAVKYIFEKMEVVKTQFHYSDMILPWLAPNRSYVFMTTIYDFYTTCSEFDDCYGQLGTVVSKKQILNQLQQEQAKLKEQIQLNSEKKVFFTEHVMDIKKQLADHATRNDEDQLAIKKLQFEEQVQMEKINSLEEQEQKLQEIYSKVDNERKYYDSLIVSDDSKVIESHGKLQKKKEECFLNLRQLEQKVYDGSSKLSQFDTVLSLYDALNQVLRGEITVEEKSFDLKGIYNAASALKKEEHVLEKEERELEEQLREKDESLPCSQNELARLDAEKDSITCTWKEKQGRYRSLLNDLQRSLSELTHRAQIEEAGLKDTVRKLTQLSTLISEKEEEIRQMDKEGEENCLLFEAELIRLLQQMNNEALMYKRRMQNMG